MPFCFLSNRIACAIAAVVLTSALLSYGQPAAKSAAAAPLEAGTKTFAVKGVVKELKADGKTVVVQHEEIPNYMAAMTMPLEVKNTNELAGLKPGDQISFRLLVTETYGWIDSVVKLGTANTPNPPPDSDVSDGIIDVLKPGDTISNLSFTNELGRAVHLFDFKDQALAITFIYTRCPFPNFCPKMSSNFAEAYKKLAANPNAPKNWRLLSLSFDPAHDTPEVLKNYAKRYQYDTNHWSFITGAPSNIETITAQFGLAYPREGLSFNHNLRTVVIDAESKVQKIFPGNEWTVDDLIAEITEAAKVK